MWSWSSNRRVGLDVLMACWGVGTWLGVNGVYVQLPLLVETLPEGWALPSSMTFAVASANVGLLLYAGSKRLFPRISEPVYIYGLLIILITGLLLNAFLYTQTVVINNQERSVAFLALTFSTALVGCTSSVLFYPYMRHFRDIYLPTYLVGEGLSGFLPSILSLIQGVSGEPECIPGADGGLVPVYPPALFSTTVFMLVLACLGAISLGAFTGIDRSSTFASERAALTAEAKDAEDKDDVGTAAVAKQDEAEMQPESLLQPHWLGVMALMVVINLITNGVMPSVQSYSCMPYGASTYLLAMALSTMANPLACLVGVWLQPVAWWLLGVALAVTAAPLGYIIATALMSPDPPLVGKVGGEVLVVSSWVWATLVLSYARMWVYAWARRGGARGMRLTGAVTQAGSLVGALTLFIIVNFTDVFTQPDPCAHYYTSQ